MEGPFTVEPDYFRDVIEDLKALTCCWQWQDPVSGCRACPFKEDRFDRDKCKNESRLVESLEGILPQFSDDEEARRLLLVIKKCNSCDEEFCDSCQYSEESLMYCEDTFFQHCYEYLMEQGLFNADGSVSEKGKQIRVSDTLALLKAMGLTKDSWEERGGLL